MIYYVNAQASKDGNGSREMPFRHIDDAARLAVAGDEVIVAPGVYREYVNPRNAGTEENRIVYRSETPLGAVITGAEELTGWKKFQGSVWMAKVDNGVFGDYNPYTTFVCGDWYFAPTVRHTGAVYLNDRMMYEAVSLEECLNGEADPCSWQPGESRYKWYTEQENGCTVLYANFQGLDPNTQKIEINVRRNCWTWTPMSRRWRSWPGATASCPRRTALATSPSPASTSTRPPPPGRRPRRTRTA